MCGAAIRTMQETMSHHWVLVQFWFFVSWFSFCSNRAYCFLRDCIDSVWFLTNF